jgi:acyl-CoA synthetase (AMP-forming)/AMP-acid ligase II
MRMRQRNATLNSFYRLESIALDKSPAVHGRCFLHYQGTEWTYKETYDITLKHATWLKERYGVKKGDIIAMDFTNKPSFLWLWFGLWALGATPAFLNYNLEGDRLVHCVKASLASLLLVDDEVAHVLDNSTTKTALENGGERKIVVFDSNTAAVVATWRATRPPDSERNGVLLPDLAMLIYTSGTTGMPKAAVVSWQKINYGTGFCTRWMGLKKTDRFYTSMPLYHSSATILGVGNVLQAGCTLVLGHKFSSTRTIPELKSSKATIFQYVGETCRYLLSAPPSPDDKAHSIRMAFGNGLRPDVWKEFKDRFGIDTIAEFYASTEGTSGSWHYQTGEFGFGAVGKNGPITDLFLNINTRIVKLDIDTELPYRDPKTDFCIQCKSGEPGEVIWKLDPNDIKAKFQGYFGNEKATNEKILRDCFVKGDAWFRTGDLQRRDPDGLWYFLDRIGDTFRWKSENVSTTEVAAELGNHPAIEECAVYGVKLPHHEGRAGCAAIVLRDGNDAEQVLKTMEDAVKGLPKYARPVFIRIVKDLEKTGNNKISKRALQNEGVQGGTVENVWWCPTPGKWYVRFGPEDWNKLGRGGVKL